MAIKFFDSSANQLSTYLLAITLHVLPRPAIQLAKVRGDVHLHQQHISSTRNIIWNIRFDLNNGDFNNQGDWSGNPHSTL